MIFIIKIFKGSSGLQLHITEHKQEMLQYVTNAPERPLILTLIPGCDLEPGSCTGHKLSFCFTFLCDPDLGQRTLILIMTYHLIIEYLYIKSN